MSVLNMIMKAALLCLLLISLPLHAATVANVVGGLPGNPYVPDPDINNALLQAVAKDNIIASLNVSLTTHNGIVSLVGQVNSDSEAGEFIAVAMSIPGVKDVNTSQLTTLQFKALSTDLVLTAKVKGSLVRGKAFGDATVNTLPISVITSNGIVYLKGTVDSTSQMIYAIKIAQMTPGVPRVISELAVRLLKNVQTN